MNLNTTLELFASFFGLASGVFFAIGVLHVKESTLEKVAVSMWDKGAAIATELAQQKTDYMFGAFLLFLSFLIQVSSKLLPREFAEIVVTPSLQSRMALCFAALTIVLCAIYIPWRRLRGKSVAKIAALAAAKA